MIAVLAPAGYGKTTLLSEWAEHDRRPFAWVSVDAGDADPGVFLAHVATALHRIEPLDREVLEVVASPGSSNPTRVVRRLGAALSARERPFVLALDDLDRCPQPITLDVVEMLTDHLPRRSLIAITARTVPPMRLARLRAAGRLVEIGAEDLALGHREAGELLRGAGAHVTAARVRELTEATEGWPVGLYLAALSLQDQRRSGVPAIRFTGDDRYVTDYIRSEVLGKPSRERQRFLVRTSILERLSGSLCDAVLERSGSARTLESIERRNLLLVPLDRERRWYRYHHLLGDVLRSELDRREPEIVPELHRRAADWFEERGLFDDALAHAHGGGDLARASRLFQRNALRNYQLGRIATLRGWLDRFGDHAIANDAGLAILAALVAALGGDPIPADRWADVVDAASANGPSLHGSASLRSSRAIMHAILARDGVQAMRDEAELAVREEQESSPFRAAAVSFLGLAALTAGDLETADGLFAEAAEIGPRIGGFPGAALSLAERSLIATARGDRAAAEAFAHQALAIVDDHNLHDHITTGPVRAACARVALRAGDRERARRELAAGHRLRTIMTYAFPTISVQARLELARVHLGLSDLAGSRTLLGEVDEILAHRPDLGTLTEQAHELRGHVGSMRSGRSPGPSTLTAAEIRILNLLPTHLTFKEIGARLFVSPNTVKTQAISIYRKLGVSSRSAAVQAARDVGLLEA